MTRIKTGESRTYIVPLKKEVLKTPMWRRSKKAMRAMREYLSKHTKADKIVFSRWVNEAVWARGSKTPPAKIKVKVVLKEDEIDVKGSSKKVKVSSAYVDLAELPARAARVKTKEEKKKTLRERLKEKFSKSEEEEVPTEEKEKAENKAEKKEEQKETAKVTREQELNMNPRKS